MITTVLNPDRYFSSDLSVRSLARELYETVASLPLVCHIIDMDHVREMIQDLAVNLARHAYKL